MNWMNTNNGGYTDLPYTQVMVLFLARLIEQMVEVSVIQQLPYFMTMFGVPWLDTGYYSGWSLFARSIVSALTAPFHGILIDRYKQRHVFAFEMFMMCLVTTVLALANSQVYLSLAVALLGIFQSIIIVNRVIACNISTIQNESVVMTIAVSAGSSLGCFLGPVLAGALLPQQNDVRMIHSRFIKQHPLVLPYMVMAGIALAASILGYVFLPDCIHSKSTKKYEQIPHHEKLEFDGPKVASYKNIAEEMVRNRGFVILNILWAIHGGGFANYTASLGLILETPVEKGGAGYFPKKVSKLMAIAGVPVVIIDFIIIGPVIHTLGARKAILGTYLSMILIRCLPGIVLGMPDKVYFWFIALDVAIARALLSAEQSSISILFNEVTPKQILGKATCLTHLFSAVGEAIFIFGAGFLFAWSLRNEKLYDINAIGFPFNHSFTCYVSSVLALSAAVFSSFIPKRCY